MELPTPKDTLESDSVNVGVMTARVKVVLEVMEPEVPVTVTVELPMAAVLLAVNVNWLLPVVGLREKDEVTPLGSPVTARLTLPLNPFRELTKMVEAPELP